MTGKITNVPAGADLQAAVDAAQPGDTLMLAAGATYRGPITLPLKTGEGWIVLRSSRADELATGRRVGPGDAERMARIVGDDGSEAAIRTARGAHHYRLVGLDLTVTPGVYNLALVRLGTGEETTEDALPHHFVIERCYVHGDPRTGGKRGISLNARHVAIVDSHFTDWKSMGQETQAIQGWNGPGPFKIVNNHLEASGINLMFGGGDPTIPNLVPADIEIRRNTFTKPLAWRDEKWVAKNLLELKNARRVLVEGNVFTRSWGHAQDGFAILLSPRNQEGKAPWSVVEDVTFVNNIVRGAGSGMKITGRDDSAPSRQTRRIVVRNNLFEDIDGRAWGGDGRLFALLYATEGVVIEHNTAFPSGSVISAEGPPHAGFVFRNNVTLQGEYGIKASGTTAGEPTLRGFFPGARVEGNLFITRDPIRYPSGNSVIGDVKDAGFADPARRDWRLKRESRFKAAAGGHDPGADFDVLTRVGRSLE